MMRIWATRYYYEEDAVEGLLSSRDANISKFISCIGSRFINLMF